MENDNTKNIVFNNTISKKPMLKKEKGSKRVESLKWTFTTDDYLYENQLKIIKCIQTGDISGNLCKTILQQINKKIYGYKQQDIDKGHLDTDKFVNIDNVVNKMIECQLKCYYCECEMNVLYDISREAKQWTIDRIDNDLGHNCDNFYIACLDCNLKRRRRSDDKFLFTKQMKIVKIV